MADVGVDLLKIGELARGAVDSNESWGRAMNNMSVAKARASAEQVANPCEACAVREWAVCSELPTAAPVVAAVETIPVKLDGREIAAGTTLYAEGEPWREFYTITEGWLFLYNLLENGRRQISKIAVPGDFVGFMPVFDASMDHSAEALTNARLCVIWREALITMMRDQPDLAVRMIWGMGRDIQMARERLTSVGQRTARERIAHFLLELCERLMNRQLIRSVDEFPLPLTQEHIGDALGLTAVHVNRTLRGLREDGVLSIYSRQLHVHDWHALKMIAGADPDS